MLLHVLLIWGGSVEALLVVSEALDVTLGGGTWPCWVPLVGTERLLLAASSVDKGECVGGSTLSLLHDRSVNYTGDSQAQELCLYLTKAASVPYFEILEKWIYRGTINDPYR